MNAHRVICGDRAGWAIHFAYDEVVIVELKRRVAPEDRSWNSETRLWWVAAEYEDVLLDLLPEFEPFLRQAALPGFV